MSKDSRETPIALTPAAFELHAELSRRTNADGYATLTAYEPELLAELAQAGLIEEGPLDDWTVRVVRRQRVAIDGARGGRE
jgi:hypothetical protein